ncbi:GNAT family N-acetyltransferase [Paracoccaceae bacterium]|nr:GNAT family N-acetyltransferase [Paracoccaceae bacterium]
MDFRIGTADDATTLALVMDAAGRRLPSYFWSQYAADGQSFFEFGREKIRSDTEGKSYYKNWHVAEKNSNFVGAFFGFIVDNPYPEIDYEDEPEWWIPFKELEMLASGTWLLQVISILPEHRGKNYAKDLLLKAEKVALEHSAKKITLQVEQVNNIAMKAYLANGYQEVGRREFIPFPFSNDSGDLILMEKTLS